MEYPNNNQNNQQTEMTGAEQNSGGVQPKIPNRSLKIIIGVLIVLLVTTVGVAGFYIYKNKTASNNEQTTPTGNSITTPGPTVSKPAEQSINYSVVVKENPNDKTKTDVYLKNPKTAQENFYITLSDIYRGHYHNAEYHNGNLYIIHRIGGDSGYQTNPNWTDELWRYDQQKKGVKLFSNRGLDFRVSEDEKFIAVIGSGDNNVTGENLTFIKTDGTVLKIFSPNQLGLENIRPIKWATSNFWVSGGYGPGIENIVKIEAINLQTTKFDVSSLSITIRIGEFDLNPTKEKITFSNYPAIFDVDSRQEYEQSGAKVDLVVYDLKTKVQQQIATSITKKFEPKWIDENTLEYNNPNDTGRLIKQIP